MAYLLGTISVVGWIWMIVIAFREEEIVWGVVMILFMPAGFIYGILRWSVAGTPFLIFILPIVAIGVFGVAPPTP